MHSNSVTLLQFSYRAEPLVVAANHVVSIWTGTGNRQALQQLDNYSCNICDRFKNGLF